MHLWQEVVTLAEWPTVASIFNRFGSRLDLSLARQLQYCDTHTCTRTNNYITVGVYAEANVTVMEAHTSDVNEVS